MPALLLKFLLKYWLQIAIVAVIAGGAFALHNKGYAAGLAKGEARLEAVLAQQAKEAFIAREKAVEAVRRGGLLALAQAEKGRQKAAAEAAAWRRKYQSALSLDPECAAWSNQLVSCPLPSSPAAPAAHQPP